jgi:putative ATP-binding cassette transporter
MRRMLAMTVLAGFANAFLLVAVNQVAGMVAEGERPGVWLLLGFCLAFSLYYISDRTALLGSNRIIERLLRDLRVSVIARLRRSELATADSVGRGSLYTMVSQETNHLSVTFPLIVECFQQSVLLAVSLIYLGYLSIPALIVFLIAVGLGILGYMNIDENFRDTLARLGQRQGELLDAIGAIIDGSKELRLNTRRSDSVYAAYTALSRSGQALQTQAGELWVSMVLVSGFVIYFMLGVVGFAFPQYIDGHSMVVFQLVPTLLFCIAPLTRIVAQSPMFLRAEVGLGAILEVERKLEAAPGVDPEAARAAAVRWRDFRRIELRELTFSYRSRSGDPLFTAGPLNLDIKRGETLFVVGGNGGGKSTSLRLLTGLYAPDHGSIAVDGEVLDREAVGGYRELFSAIFADFHLFDRLYGLEDVDRVRVHALIDEMGLAGKVRYEGGRFTDLNLSTGQRKRLAMIATLLEDRPIVVFDEWSAEQDVHFREVFYTKIIPGLKARGITVIAVTHDDRYWHVADRVVKLDLGRVEWERAGADLMESS